MRVNHSARSGSIIGIFNMKVCCVFSLESPHRCDSNEYTQHNHYQYKKRKSPEIIRNTIMSAALEFFIMDSRTSSKKPW